MEFMRPQSVAEPGIQSSYRLRLSLCPRSAAFISCCASARQPSRCRQRSSIAIRPGARPRWRRPTAPDPGAATTPFGREAREGGQSAAEAGDDEHAPLGRQGIVQRKECHGDADDVAAHQIGGQRAQRHHGTRTIEATGPETSAAGSPRCHRHIPPLPIATCITSPATCSVWDGNPSTAPHSSATSSSSMSVVTPSFWRMVEWLLATVLMLRFNSCAMSS